MYVPGGDAIIEVRSADAYCNPYITFQMLLRAGMEGIHHQEQLKEEWDAALEQYVELSEMEKEPEERTKIFYKIAVLYDRMERCRWHGKANL